MGNIIKDTTHIWCNKGGTLLSDHCYYSTVRAHALIVTSASNARTIIFNSTVINYLHVH